MQMDPAPSIRRFVAEFCTAALQVRPSPPVLTCSAQCAAALMMDTAAAVARQAAVFAHVVLQMGVAAHAAVQVSCGLREQHQRCIAVKTLIWVMQPRISEGLHGSSGIIRFSCYHSRHTACK